MRSPINEGTCDSITLETYAKDFLIKELKRGQIVAMDNINFHKEKKLEDLIKSVGIRENIQQKQQAVL